MRSKEEIYEQYIGNGQYGIDFEKKHILEAMDEYASEVLREELIRYDKWCAKHWIEPDINTAEQNVDEYLKTK